jgi:hypothetical protein
LILCSELRIASFQLLPYPAVLLPLTYFFNVMKNKKPNNEQVRLLSNFLLGRVDRAIQPATESKLAEDLNKMDLIKGSMLITIRWN